MVAIHTYLCTCDVVVTSGFANGKIICVGIRNYWTPWFCCECSCIRVFLAKHISGNIWLSISMMAFHRFTCIAPDGHTLRMWCLALAEGLAVKQSQGLKPVEARVNQHCSVQVAHGGTHSLHRAATFPPWHWLLGSFAHIQPLSAGSLNGERDR